MVFIEGSNIPFPTDHEQMVGFHTIRNDNQRSLINNSDLVTSAGAELFSDWFWQGCVDFDKTKMIFLDSKPNSLGRQPSKITGIGNLKVILNQIIETVDFSKISNVIDRKNRISAIKKENDEIANKAADSNWNNELMSPERAMFELSKAVPKDSIIVNDAISHKSAVMQYIKF